MFNAKRKKYVLIVLTVFILAGLLISYGFWKNNQERPKIALENSIQEETREVIMEEAVKAEPVEIIKETEPAPKEEKPSSVNYFLHKNISSTVFWVGEGASDENGGISNSPSAWDEQWEKHYGGVDSVTKRNGFFPAKFYPKENPFYAALPYNDFGENGEHKPEIFSLVPWAKNRNIPKNYSVLKNRWIKIMHEGKTAYAQWEDVGPFGEDDKKYVFGNAFPKSKENNNAGIDVSPAVRDYLGLSDIDKVDWQFVNFEDVADGAWKKIITTSQVYWK